MNSKDLTIAEIKLKEKALVDNIHYLISKFEQETKCSVFGIDVKRQNERKLNGEQVSWLLGVVADVRISCMHWSNE